MSDFDVITDKDKSHVAYGMCVLGTFAAGGALGSMASPGLGTVIGALGGGVFGLYACKTVEQPLKDRLFSASSTMMTPVEFSRLANQTARAFPHLSREQVLDMIAQSRHAAMTERRKFG